MKYTLKDKRRYETICSAFPEFEGAFQLACNGQLTDKTESVLVSGGKRRWRFEFKKSEIIEALDTNTWYPAEKFDGNPNNHILLEHRRSGLVCAWALGNNAIAENVTYFMYLERPKQNGADD